MRRRVQCVPPKPMVISVDNNGGQGAWLRLFIEVSPPLHHSDWLLPASSSAHLPVCKPDLPPAECPLSPGDPALCQEGAQRCGPVEHTCCANARRQAC